MGHEQNIFESPYPQIWLALVIIILLVLLCIIGGQDCAHITTSVFTGLMGYGVDLTYSVLQTILYSYEHIPLEWYLLAALTVVALCLEISKSMAILFFTLYCIIALTLCLSLPSFHKKKKIKQQIQQNGNALGSKLFANTRINI